MGCQMTYIKNYTLWTGNIYLSEGNIYPTAIHFMMQMVHPGQRIDRTKEHKQAAWTCSSDLPWTHHSCTSTPFSTHTNGSMGGLVPPTEGRGNNPRLVYGQMSSACRCELIMEATSKQLLSHRTSRAVRSEWCFHHSWIFLGHKDSLENIQCLIYLQEYVKYFQRCLWLSSSLEFHFKFLARTCLTQLIASSFDIAYALYKKYVNAQEVGFLCFILF